MVNNLQPSTLHGKAVRYNPHLLNRLQYHWANRTSPYASKQWIRWYTQLLSGTLAKANPVQENDLIMRKKQAK